MKTDTTDWHLIKLPRPQESLPPSEANLSADEILYLYCKEIEQGCASRLTRLRLRVDAWKAKHYSTGEESIQMLEGKR